MESIGNIATKLVDRWAWYQAALKDPTQIGNTLKIYDGEPQQGYYRVRPKGGQWEPVAIFYPEDSDSIVAYRNGKEVRADDIWLWCCRHPISFEAYEKAMAGGGFDDEPAPARGIGDNSGEADPFDALTIEYLGEKEQAESFLKTPVKTKADADRAAIWADRLKKIASKATAFHKVEKQPFLDGGRAVDEKWRGLKEEPGTVVDALRAHVKPYFAELKRQEEERQRIAREKAEQERREAEEKARAAREAAAKAEEGDLAAEKARQEAEDAARRAKEAEKEAEARKVSAGRTGARMGMKTETVYVVTDYLKAATAMLALGNADLKAEIDRLAKRLMKAGVPLDGVEARDEEVVR